MAPSVKLYGTPLSHFTRKIRVLLLELGVPFEFVRIPGVLATRAEAFGDNPLMRVPTLLLGEQTLIESDHIARKLVRTFDPDDRLGVFTDDVGALNRLAVANGIMANAVVRILSKRGGLEDLDGVVYLRKLATAIDSGLAWLEAGTDPEAAHFDYADIALACMWQHANHYQLVPGLDRHVRIAARVERLMRRPSIAKTTPDVSLAEAKAAGWVPA